MITQPIINGRPFLLYHPDNQRQFGEPTPSDYWKYQWRCGGTLAAHLMTLTGKGKRYLELGPGLGLCSVVAAYRGFDVTIVDREALALEYTRTNLEKNHLPSPNEYLMTWKEFSGSDAGKYDVIVASDCCYDRNATLDVLHIFDTKIAPVGTCYATDQLTENYLLEILSKQGTTFTQTMYQSPIAPELPARYDRPQNCLFTIPAPKNRIP